VRITLKEKSCSSSKGSYLLIEFILIWVKPALTKSPSKTSSFKPSKSTKKLTQTNNKITNKLDKTGTTMKTMEKEMAKEMEKRKTVLTCIYTCMPWSMDRKGILIIVIFTILSYQNTTKNQRKSNNTEMMALIWQILTNSNFKYNTIRIVRFSTRLISETYNSFIDV